MVIKRFNKMDNIKPLIKKQKCKRAQLRRPRPMSLVGFLFWFAAISVMASFSLLLTFEFHDDGLYPYGVVYVLVVLLLLLLTIYNIFQAPARNGCMLIGVIVLSILANGWLIDLSIWVYPVGPDQPYIVKMKPDDVSLLLVCAGQIIAEIAAGTIALFAAMVRRSGKNINQDREVPQGNGQ